MLPSFFIAFPPPPPLIHPPLSPIDIGILEGKKEVGKKDWLEKRGGVQQKKDQRR